MFLFLVIFLGAFGIACLNNFDAVTDQIRNRWLPNTRFLGDLNNYTSDFRAAEGTLLLASGPADAQAGEQEMEALDRAVARAQRGYEQVYHDEAETGSMNASRRTGRLPRHRESGDNPDASEPQRGGRGIIQNHVAVGL